MNSNTSVTATFTLAGNPTLTSRRAAPEPAA